MSSIKKTDHFYLVDGSGYIFRAYYALPPLSRKSDGLPTGAVSGFCSMLFKLLEDARADDSKNIPKSKLRSRAKSDSKASIPNPGHAKTDSTITDPPINAPT